MDPLSSQIYNAISDKAAGSNLKHRNRAIWTWTFLLGRNSPEMLHSLLHDIEETFHKDHFEDQQLLELGWKAESVELLLREFEVAVPV